MKKFILRAMAIATAVAFTASCSDNGNNEDSGDDNDNDQPATEAVVDGLFVVNAGNFGSPTSSLTFYDLENATTSQNVFFDANGMKLGDTAQSMTIGADGTAWVCVNNSNVVFAIDPVTYKEKGRVEGVVSPRYVLQVSDDKAYVSQLYTDYIAIVDTKTYTVTGKVEIPSIADASMGSTEEMLLIDGYVYCNCWSYQKTIVKIDPKTDKVVAELEVGIQPQSMAYDEANATLWVLTDGGGWDQNPVGYEAPALVAVNLKDFSIARTLDMTLGQSVSSLKIHDGCLYWLGWGVFRMPVAATAVPENAFIPASDGYYYAMTIDPANGDVYVADALDFMQAGRVDIFDTTGAKKSSFAAGVIPTNFCWRTSVK